MKTINDFTIEPYIPSPIFGPDDWVSVDIESFGMKKGKFHRPIGDFACLALTNDGERVWIYKNVEDLGIFWRSIEDANLIFQNATFDVYHLRRWMQFPTRESFHDTLLIDRILWGGYYEEFNLKALTRRYLKAYMEKETRNTFEKANTLTDEMIEYNARDAVVQWRIAQDQMKLMKKSHRRVWCEADLPAMWGFLDFKGPLIDSERWREVAEENARVAGEMFDDYQKRFGINPRAPGQVKAFLEKKYNITLENTLAETLEKIANKYPEAQEILDYRKIEKRRSTYGLSWLKKHVEGDGRVYTEYDVNMAESGRTASRNPNIQNIPVRETPVFRECFIAGEGNILVGGDYAQQEIRCAAYLSQDENLIELLASGRDIYSEIASMIHGETIEKSDPRRQAAKSVVLGTIYGLTPFGLARRERMSEEDAETLMNKFFGLFPRLKSWMDKQQRATDYVRTALGRKSWLNPYNKQAKRNALNSPPQGSAADMMKVAVGLLHKRWDTRQESFAAILQVHDELVLEVKEKNADYAKELLHTCMLEAGERVIPGIQTVVDIRIGSRWSDVH
ncbi:MAG TPA: DNA polymerase [Candidatus Hodarchaeales archaeon]|nr:DNA polymerase [Candidatus Hodarchaeales archaeon]